MNKILKRFLTLRLRVQEFFFLLQKVDVATVDAQRTIGINPIELDHIWPEKSESSDQVKVQCVHGSPLDEDEYIIVMRDAYQPLLASDATITFFGHTHIQGGFCTHGEEWETLRPVYRTKREMESCDLAITPGAKYLINPGSAGQPRDGDWRAACALLDTNESRVTFYRVPYDVKKAQERIFSAKLPDRLALRLSEGR